MDIKPISILLTGAAAMLSACQNTGEYTYRDNIYTDTETSNANKEGKSFRELIGKPFQRHTFNQAISRDIEITMPTAAEEVTVYGTVYGRYYRLAGKKNPGQQEKLMFEAPRSLEKLIVVADGLEYVTSANKVEITGTGSPVTNPEVYTSAEPLGWIYAADTGEDFDFNDAIFRFVSLPTGDLQITAMAAGINKPIWLHYCHDGVDYTISPKAYNGYWIETRAIQDKAIDQYHLHNWFTGAGESTSTGYCINTLSLQGANFITGQTVTIPASEITAHGYVSMRLICISDIVTDNQGKQYAKPVDGFYITVNVYDTTKIDLINSANGKDYTLAESIVCPWPSGYDPYVIVVPDISEKDSREHHTGWQWPSEWSRIDMTYPSFKQWLSDPTYSWSEVTPSGWYNRPATISEYGEYKYYGYYPR